MLAMSAAVADFESPSAPGGGVIDRNHLARTTLGDKGLEREVLQLFDRQSELLLARMNDAPVAAVLTLAHTLKGSARGIGAWQVADAAEAVEGAVGTQADGDRVARAYGRLTAAVGEARAAIASLLRGH
jgi:HPt (histidine-containing phosphotransfer) domain-containing protein